MSLKRFRTGLEAPVMTEADSVMEAAVQMNKAQRGCVLVNGEDGKPAELWTLADLGIARVTEDLIDLLIDKGVISFTELPENAQKKLIDRRGLRNELGYVAKLFNEDDELI